ncbi:hypothetical protein PIB30_087389 [Stylosanthes scabra]|uniref:Uncharacterized protein n=1 Tax=Stylosanthes scabra TaxID=79078 RepID=A0ABU6YU74_9FABA|nr:hypothetical protein [Stylosanthes scabra]
MSSEMIQDSGIMMILMTGELQNQLLVLRQAAPVIPHRTVRSASCLVHEDRAHFKCGVVGLHNFHKQFGKLKKGSLQIKKRNLEAKQSRVPRICVEEHADACCSYPNPCLSKLTTLRRGNSLDQIHAYA